MSKSELRKCMSAIVGRLNSLEKQQQSRIVFESLIKHPKYLEAKRLFIYLSTDNEIDTRPILRQALDCDNKQCFVPFVRKTAIKADDRFVTRMLMVQLISMNDYDQLPVNNYGIKEHKDLADSAQIAEPPEETTSAAASSDLILVPGVAFARDGRRLGHGKGYYDEFLHHWRAAAGSNETGVPYTIGLALKEQLVEDPLAEAGHDYKLDEVICAHPYHHHHSQ